ncbi:MAG TPA: class I SAM-dependent methyltransferase [Bryobacteraceae bacterium]|nr:class I SAM-dependent methyltransferase [Bryobacteraceae bacterium]
MHRLHEMLIDGYAGHYAQVNATVNPRAAGSHYGRALDRMCGDLIARCPAGSEILDLGCGTGMLLYWLARQPGITAVGVDASVGQVQMARRFLPDLEIHLSDGLAFLRGQQRRFAGIFCTDVLEHLGSNDARIEWLEAAQAALQPGGFFFCRVPNAAHLLAAYGRYIDLTHDTIFTASSLFQLLEAAGLKRCRIVPIRAAHMTGRIRLACERLLHRVIFRICGNSLDQVVTGNICAVGFNGE